MSTNNYEISLESLQKIEKAYDSPPWWYDIRGFFILTLTYRSTLGYQIKFFGNNIQENHLEVAIGTGTLFGMILKWCRKKGKTLQNIYGIDYAEPMLAGARQRFKTYSTVHLEKVDVTKMPYKENLFNSINVANAIHCFPEVEKSFKEIHRVLKPEGTLAINVLLYPRGNWLFRKIAQKINEWGMKKGILYTPYSEGNIKEIVTNAGFKIKEEKITGNALNLVLTK